MENKNSYSTRSIYAIYDKVARRILSCIDDFNDESARRNFINAINTDGSLYHANPEDFQLIRLGCYDIIDCLILNTVQTVICDGMDLVNGPVKGSACNE